ncbi:MAG: DNA-3-methyladenine glycosylase I [Planctomycetota bacterium]
MSAARKKTKAPAKKTPAKKAGGKKTPAKKAPAKKPHGEVVRCPWPAGRELDTAYHDTEWGVPLHDDRKLFEFIVLDGFQAGLSWSIILRKREAFRAAFDNFDPAKIVRYTPARLEKLMANEGIIRNRLKIEGTVKNARAFLAVVEEFSSFDRYIWQFVDGRPIVNSWTLHSEIPATSPQSDAMSKALKKRGFTFVGSTICYAFMQAAGMINDHLVSCYRHADVNAMT